MSIYKVQHATNLAEDTLAGPSPALWANCPVDDIQHDPGVGCLLQEDFENAFDISATGSKGGWYGFVDAAGGGIDGDPADVFGVLKIATSTTADEETHLTTGANKSGFVKITDTAGANFRVWHESRMKVDSIADLSLLIGLCEEGAAAGGLLADAGTGFDADFVGFRILEADPDGLDAVFMTSGGSEVVVLESGAVKAPSAMTLTAGTYVKVGLYFDGKTLFYFVNGQPLVLTTDITPATSGFPDGEELAFIAGLKTHTTAAKTLSLDWTRTAILRNVV